jgi:hypothetical protein
MIDLTRTPLHRLAHTGINPTRTITKALSALPDATIRPVA